MSYIHEKESIAAKFHGRIEETLTTIADRYVGAHPKHPLVFRTFCENGFIRGEDYRYVMNVDERLPDMKVGQFVYVWGKLWSEQESDLGFSVSCFGPVRIFVNGERKFQSNLNDDVFPDRKTGFRARMSKGWNHFVLEFYKTGTGCGGRFGTGSIKGAPLHFLAPTAEREGQEGWIYSEPLDERLSALPQEGDAESNAGIRWYPAAVWSEREQALSPLERMFGVREGQAAVAWTKLRQQTAAGRSVTLQGRHTGKLTVLLNGQPVYESGGSGEMAIPLTLPFGEHDLLVQSECPGAGWGFELGLKEGEAEFIPPHPVLGLPGTWLYAGPFPQLPELRPEQWCVVDTVFDDGGEGVYWRADQPGMRVRPYLENPMFGKWNYPLGVTLYGLMQTGVELGRDDYVDYVLDHIELSTSMDRYARWDMKRYGAPGINHQLAAIDSLDDCGSFGATTVLAMGQRELKGARESVDRIADYISNVQDRTEEGALFRVRGTTDFMKDTMWCDDLYMSTPFLCRYYVLTGERKYIDDAARQFLLYKQRLFMPDLKIMHHVYDFKFDKPNGVPWGRGNGWVLFSLTELLAVLPADHELREELTAFFRELCEGYLRLQGENGLWHQVLTLPESYEETSCTSMFVYAFARGVRFGWLEDAQPYVAAVMKGWHGMTRNSIDQGGNVYGVCRGSGYSFSPLYYKDQLSWLLNDTHGIGIVMLAGIEALRMSRHLAGQEA